MCVKSGGFYLHLHKLRAKVSLGGDASREYFTDKLWRIVIHVDYVHNNLQRSVVRFVRERPVCRDDVAIFRRFHDQQMLLLLFSIQRSRRLESRLVANFQCYRMTNRTLGPPFDLPQTKL